MSTTTTMVKPGVVRKGELIHRLRMNRQKHLDAYNVSNERHRQIRVQYIRQVHATAMSQLERTLANILASHDCLPTGYCSPLLGEYKVVPEIIFKGFYPQCYVADYDAAIDLVSATPNSEDEYLILTIDEFDRYYRDEWSWSESFNRSISEEPRHPRFQQAFTA